MTEILDKLVVDFPELTFTAGKQFCWSPETHEVFYKKDATEQTATWSLLHETGHG
jgi:hypothetical protein